MSQDMVLVSGSRDHSVKLWCIDEQNGAANYRPLESRMDHKVDSLPCLLYSLLQPYHRQAAIAALQKLYSRGSVHTVSAIRCCLCVCINSLESILVINSVQAA